MQQGRESQTAVIVCMGRALAHGATTTRAPYPEARPLVGHAAIAAKPEGKSKLIVVADIEDHQLLSRVNHLLNDHEVRLVNAEELPSSALEIEREAH